MWLEERLGGRLGRQKAWMERLLVGLMVGVVLVLEVLVEMVGVGVMVVVVRLVMLVLRVRWLVRHEEGHRWGWVLELSAGGEEGLVGVVVEGVEVA